MNIAEDSTIGLLVAAGEAIEAAELRAAVHEHFARRVADLILNSKLQLVGATDEQAADLMMDAALYRVIAEEAEQLG